jgi:hypothetical protein
MIHLPAIYVSSKGWDTAVILHDDSDEIVDYGRVVDMIDGAQVGRDRGKADLTNSGASCVLP